MSRPDLTATPYQLDEEAIAWVRSTIDSMSVDEKVGQLFINLNNRFDDDFVNHIVDDYHPGGMRYNHTDSASIQAHIRHAQTRSKVPLLVASNIEAGGNGACADGTLIATPLQTASTPDTEAARLMGVVGGRVAGAGLQLGVHTHRGHPPQLAQHRDRHPRVRQRLPNGDQIC